MHYSADKVAKVIGVMLLCQLAGGIYLYFFFLSPLLDNHGLSQHAINHLVGLATVSAIVLSSINLWVALVSYRFFSGVAPILYRAVIAFAIIGLGLTASEYVRMAEYAALFHHFADNSEQSLNGVQQLVRKVLAEGRNEAHFMSILLSSISMLLFYLVLFYATRLPKSLTGFAVFACCLQIIAVGHSFFELSIPMPLQLPLFINQIILPIYLIVAGLKVDESSYT